MNNTFNLFNLNDAKAVGSDIVTPWIDDLLDKKNNENNGVKKRAAAILSYPVDRILDPVFSPLPPPAREDEPAVKTPAEKTFGIHIVSSIAGRAGNRPAQDDNAAFLPLKKVQSLPQVDPEKEISYFTFISGSSFYALPALNISEIIRYKTPVNIFSKKAGHLGIILYRNRMVPVYDFYMLANGSIYVKSLLKYVVVCVYNDKFFGLAVNEIKNITGIKNKGIIAESSFKFKSANNITSGVFEDAEGKFHSVIDIKSVFSYLIS